MGTTRPLSDEEYVRLLEALRGRMTLRDRCLIVMMRRGGFRISELLSLRLGDVIDQGQIPEEVQVMRRHTKGQRAGYTVPLHHEARAALAAWIEAMNLMGWQTAECFLFPRLGSENRPISRTQAWRIVRRAAKGEGGARLAGCIGCHSLRKSFGTDIYRRSGRDVRAAQEALRHASLDSTLHYLPVTRERLQRLILGQAAIEDEGQPAGSAE